VKPFELNFDAWFRSDRICGHTDVATRKLIVVRDLYVFGDRVANVSVQDAWSSAFKHGQSHRLSKGKLDIF
jgi:hypothetical protein